MKTYEDDGGRSKLLLRTSCLDSFHQTLTVRTRSLVHSFPRPCTYSTQPVVIVHVTCVHVEIKSIHNCRFLFFSGRFLLVVLRDKWKQTFPSDSAWSVLVGRKRRSEGDLDKSPPMVLHSVVTHCPVTAPDSKRRLDVCTIASFSVQRRAAQRTPTESKILQSPASSHQLFPDIFTSC